MNLKDGALSRNLEKNSKKVSYQYIHKILYKKPHQESKKVS